MCGVSVIVPAHNHARFIAQTLDSVLAQTYSDVEIIVVDDGSTDNTQGVLEAYRDRIQYIYQQNQGPSAARNVGIGVSQGKYLLFLDADDLIPPQKLELQVNALSAHPEWGLVYSGWQYVDERGARILFEIRPNKQGVLLKELLLRSFFFPIAAALVRRECFQTSGLFDESLRAAEDTDLWARMAKAGYSFGYLDEILFQYRVVKGSATGNIQHQMMYEFNRLDKFFASADLGDDIVSLKSKAYSVLMFESAAKYYYAGDISMGRDYLKEATKTYPALANDQNWLVEWLAGSALSPRIDDPMRLLDTVFDNLPPEAATLGRLRRKTVGRYHTAIAFSEYHNHNLMTTRRHVIPAVLGDPAILLNRGFIRIALDSLLNR